MKVRIEIDENMSEDEIVIRCAQPDERVLKMKRVAESAEGDPEIAFFKDAVQFYPPLDSIPVSYTHLTLPTNSRV